jgi:uncharacterized protein
MRSTMAVQLRKIPFTRTVSRVRRHYATPSLLAPLPSLVTPTRPHDDDNVRSFSSWGARGYDLTNEMMSGDGHQQRPLLIIQAYAPTGFDVEHVLRNVQDNPTLTGGLHMHGSMLAFPHACFLWKGMNHAHQVTLESLAPVFLHRPPMEFLFVAWDATLEGISLDEWTRIETAARNVNMVVEQTSVAHAIGMFNLLNAEGRIAAAALLLPPPASQEEDSTPTAADGSTTSDTKQK